MGGNRMEPTMGIGQSELEDGALRSKEEMGTVQMKVIVLKHESKAQHQNNMKCDLKIV